MWKERQEGVKLQSLILKKAKLEGKNGMGF